MKDETRPPVFLDIDGYLRQAIEAGEVHNRALGQDPDRLANFRVRVIVDPSVRELVELYYLAIREACVMVDMDDGDHEGIEKANQALRKWRQSALESAMSLAYQHISTGTPPIPDWITLAKETILSTLSSSYPTARDVPITAMMVPRLSARARKNGVIEVSGFTRILLRQYNIAVCSAVERSMVDSRLRHEPDVVSLIRETLPYLIHAHDIVPIHNLPYLSAANQQSAERAISLTQTQLVFIVAHEYAHILLGHTRSVDPAARDRAQMELDADAFALKICLTIARECEVPLHELWTALRWLFQYQNLDQLVGSLVRNEKVDFDSLFERRRSQLQNTLLANQSAISTHFEIAGSWVLFNMKGLLHELGSDYVEYVYDALMAATPNAITPWWERARSASTPELGLPIEKGKCDE